MNNFIRDYFLVFSHSSLRTVSKSLIFSPVIKKASKRIRKRNDIKTKFFAWYSPYDNEEDGEHEGDEGKGMGQPVSDVHQDVTVQVERLRDQVDEPKNLQKDNSIISRMKSN